MVAYGASYPTPGPGGLTDANWRRLAGAWGDGIVNAFGSGGTSSFAIVPSSSDRTLVLHLDEVRIQGIHFEPTQSTLTLTIPDVAAGQTRTDRLLLRYDPTAAAADKVTFYIKAGTAVSTGTPPRPSYSRVVGGVWEVCLSTFTGGNVAANALTYEDMRLFVSERLHSLLPPGKNTELNQGRSDGAQVYDAVSGHTWVQSYPGGVATWKDIDDPDWSDLNIGTGMIPGTSAPQWRLRRGQLEMRGNGRRAPASNGGVWAAGTSALEQRVGTLPASVAPGVQHTWVAGVEGGMNGVARCYVQTSGEIYVTIYPNQQIAGLYFDCVRYTPGA